MTAAKVLARDAVIWRLTETGASAFKVTDSLIWLLSCYRILAWGLCSSHMVLSMECLNVFNVFKIQNLLFPRMSNPRNKDRSYNALQATPYLSCCIPTTFWYPLAGRMPLFSAGAATLVITETAQGWTLSVCCVLYWNVYLSGGAGCHQQMPWKTLLVPLLLFSVLELGFASRPLSWASRPLSWVSRPPSTTPGQWRGQWGLCGTRWSTLTPSPGPGWVPEPSWRRAHGYSSTLWKPTTASAAAPCHCLSPKHPLFLGAELKVASDVSSPAPCVSEALLSPHSCLCRVGPPSFPDPSPSYKHAHVHQHGDRSTLGALETSSNITALLSVKGCRSARVTSVWM